MTQIHPLLITKTNIARAGGDLSLDKLLAAYINFIYSIPKDADEYFVSSCGFGGYHCGQYVVHEGTCTCQSWQKQVSLKNWLGEQGIPYSPLCKHMAIVDLKTITMPPRINHVVLWDIIDGNIQTWLYRGAEIKLYKSLLLSEFRTIKIASLEKGWRFSRRSSAVSVLLQRTGSR